MALRRINFLSLFPKSFYTFTIKGIASDAELLAARLYGVSLIFCICQHFIFIPTELQASIDVSASDF